MNSPAIKLVPERVNQMVSIQKEVKFFRKAMDLTQQNLAERMGISRECITMIECMINPINIKYILMLHQIIQNDLRNERYNNGQIAWIHSLYDTTGLKEFIESI